MGTALEGGEGGELDAEGGGGGGEGGVGVANKGGLKGCFVFTSWLIGAFDISTMVETSRQNTVYAKKWACLVFFHILAKTISYTPFLPSH